MRSFTAALILFSGVALSQGNSNTSFDSTYLQLQKKIADLKEHGEKINDDARKDIDNLMVQLNHEHEQMRHELELKNQQIAQKVDAGKRTGQDWSERIQGAGHELKSGFEKAWAKLSKADD